jgi:uncharacterized protein
MNRNFRCLSVAGVLSVAALAGTPSVAQQTIVTVGTGAVTGVYYAAGGAVCFVMNKERKRHGFRCSVESTNGSISNLEALRAGNLQFGIVQSDWQHHAVEGTHRFKDLGADANLRSLFSMHAEAVTVLAGRHAKISQLIDIKGKKINIGNAGSGTRATAMDLFEVLGWKTSDLAYVGGLDPDEHGRALCENQLDGAFYTVGHPSANVSELVNVCGARLLPLAGSTIDKLVKWKPYYAHVAIPAKTYKGQAEAIRTFGVLATAVTSSDTATTAAYEMVKAVFERLDELKRLHPAFAELDAQGMFANGHAAPMHEGALRYYREKGWAK